MTEDQIEAIIEAYEERIAIMIESGIPEEEARMEARKCILKEFSA